MIDAAGARGSTTGATGSGWRGTVDAPACASCSTAPTGRAASSVREILAATGATVEVIHDEPDGININVACRGHRARRRWPRRSSRAGADVGFALDGDADRLIAVDARGPGRRRRPGPRHPAPSTGWAAARCPAAGSSCRSSRTAACRPPSRRPAGRSSGRPVGDKYILEGMQVSGPVLGGEKSGHVIVLEHTTSGDGDRHRARGPAASWPRRPADLAELAAAIPLLPQQQRAVQARHKDQWEGDPVLQRGDRRRPSARLGATGRVLVRPSGTEPALRVMVEGPDEALVGRAGRLARGPRGGATRLARCPPIGVTTTRRPRAGGHERRT